MQSCKRCGECGEMKPLTEFNRSSKGKDGYQWKCRACYQVKNLQIDHCHETGKVRALLCKECNNALGLLHDDVERIRLLLSYAELHQLSDIEF